MLLPLGLLLVLANGPEPVVLPSTVDLDVEVAAAIEAAVDSVRAQPTSAARHFELGVTYEANGHDHAARDCYRAAADLAPEDPDVAYRLGVMLALTGAPVEAIEALSRVASSDASARHRLPAHARVGALLFELGDFERSARSWQDALALEDQVRWPQLRVGLAAALVELGEARHATALVIDVLGAHPDYGHAHSVLGAAWLELEREEEAELCLRRGAGSTFEFPLGPHADLVESARTGLAGRFARAKAALDARRLEDAVAEAVAIRQRYPDAPGVWMLLGDIARLRGEAARALGFYREGAHQHPDHLPSQLELAVRATEAARVSTGAARDALVHEAFTSSARALELAPRGSDALVVRGRVLMHLSDRRHDARELLLTAERLGAQQPGLHEDLARLSADLNDVASLVHFAELSARATPWRIEGWRYLAAVYRAVGRPADAEVIERRLEAR